MSEISNMSDMNEIDESLSQSSSLDLSQFSQVFSWLSPRDVEQFQLLYQHWAIQQQINDVQQQIVTVQRELAETVDQIERVHPSALALATLARLQASGVEDIDLLDRMLERGEEWLDRTIQHLEYCEQLDVIRGDYQEWCRHALEDAFAWLDSMQSDISTAAAPVPGAPQPAPASTSGEGAATDDTIEELFLQKIMSEEAGDSVTDTGDDEKNEEASNNVPAASEQAQGLLLSPVPTADGTHTVEQRGLEQTTLKVASVQPIAEDQDNVEDNTIGEDNSPRVQEETSGRRANFVQRFLSTLWP